MYELFEHTADLGMRIAADDVAGLFVDAGRGLFSMLVENLDDVRPERTLGFRVEGRELDYLLIDWLNELLFTFESQRVLLCDFNVAIDDHGLTAQTAGEAIDPARHRLDHEVKAITYHHLQVEQAEGRWRAEVIVDI